MNGTYRGNKPITVKELSDFLAQFAGNAEVVFYVDPDEGSHVYHADELRAGTAADGLPPDAWIELSPR